jgi:hypothetical protein
VITRNRLDESISPLVLFWRRLDQPEIGDAIVLLRKRFRFTRNGLIRRMRELSPDEDFGLDETLVYRWEKGEVKRPRPRPGPRYRLLLGRVCERQVESLSTAARTEFLNQLSAFNGPSRLLSLPGTEEGLSTSTAHGMSAQDVAPITAYYEYLRRRIPGVQLIGSVRAHIDFIARYLKETSPEGGPQVELVAAWGEACVLAGVLSFWDLHDEADARRYFEMAKSAAHETKDQALRTYALGFAAELETLTQPATAIELSRAALEAGIKMASPRVSSWLAAVEAMATAATDDAGAFWALERARKEMARAKPGDRDPQWIEFFNRPRLEAYAGDILLRAGHAHSALETLREAAANTNLSLKRDHAEIAANMALALVKEGAIEESCQNLKTAYDLAGSLSYQHGLRRVYGVRQELEPWSDTQAVKELDEHLEQ